MTQARDPRHYRFDILKLHEYWIFINTNFCSYLLRVDFLELRLGLGLELKLELRLELDLGLLIPILDYGKKLN